MMMVMMMMMMIIIIIIIIIETQTETEPELPTNLPQVNPGDVICDICKIRFPGTGSLRNTLTKCTRGKEIQMPQVQNVYITKKAQRNCELKCKVGEKPFKCDVSGYDIGFYNRRSKKKLRGSNMEIMLNRKTKYVSFKI